MRMDQTAPTTAAVVLNRWSEDELARVFREFGEEPQARRLARAVVRRREERPWARTGEFAELIGSTVGRRGPRSEKAVARVFQALRIAVNDELGELALGLERALALLVPGGRLVVISFHSLEDRMVKHFLRDKARDCVCPAWFPECRCDHRREVEVLTRKPVRAQPGELAENRRAAPARLRAAERVGSGTGPAREKAQTRRDTRPTGHPEDDTEVTS
jgi:16S rRNA (cytosine1402-N4)-methyltransferase